jgi:hypothetical protein
MAKKGVKSTRGRPEIYSEMKTSVCLALTPTAIVKLDNLAKSQQLSRSEFVERITRSLIEPNAENEHDEHWTDLPLRLDSGVQSTFIQSKWCEQKVAFDAIKASSIPLADLALIY